MNKGIKINRCLGQAGQDLMYINNDMYLSGGNL